MKIIKGIFHALLYALMQGLITGIGVYIALTLIEKYK